MVEGQHCARSCHSPYIVHASKVFLHCVRLEIWLFEKPGDAGGSRYASGVRLITSLRKMGLVRVY
jgi:hypothetical protein